ncbi:hypothetical protein N0V88_000007 [Collariella sp. IMI 366227]|nr:hypothetical protein N0V88_000007 [Collariella sp. IMI 366227]
MATVTTIPPTIPSPPRPTSYTTRHHPTSTTTTPLLLPTSSELWLMILDHLPLLLPTQHPPPHPLQTVVLLAFPSFYPRIEYTRAPSAASTLFSTASHPIPGKTAAAICDPDVTCYNTPANLSRFALLLLEFRELKAVRFAARWQNRTWRADPLAGDYLCVRTLEPYLSLLTHVTELDLDLCGTDVVDELGVPGIEVEDEEDLCGGAEAPPAVMEEGDGDMVVRERMDVVVGS